MAQTNFHKSRLFSLFSIGAIALSALAYGCSDDEETTATPKTDAGSSTDAPASTDTGSNTDTGAQVDSGSDTGATVDAADAAVPTAVVTIAPTSDGGTVNGTATFVQADGGVTVNVSITGAAAGLHGLHIHAGSNCDNLNDAGPGTGAGGHWNPDDAGHSFPDSGMSHAGDMGNIEISDAGTGTLTMSNPKWTIGSGTYNVVGHAVIFHAGEDDGTTQPTGNSGGRLGCGVIAQTK